LHPKPSSMSKMAWLALPNLAPLIPKPPIMRKAKRTGTKAARVSERARKRDMPVKTAIFARVRPLVTPSLIPPSIYNPPLPRLKPQPAHITMMMKKRIKDRQRRLYEQRLLMAWIDDNRREERFERLVAKHTPGFLPSLNFSAAEQFLRDRLKTIQESFEREKRRSQMLYTPELIAKLMTAKRQRARPKKS